MRRSIGFIARSRSKAESPPVRGGLQRVQGRQAWMESRITVIRFIWLNQDLSGYFSPKKPIIAGEAWFRIRQIIRNGSAEHPRDCRAEILRRPEKRRLGHRKKDSRFHASTQASSRSAAQLSSTHLTATISDGIAPPVRFLLEHREDRRRAFGALGRAHDDPHDATLLPAAVPPSIESRRAR